MTTTVQTQTVRTRTLLACATVAAPLWSVVALAQAATRSGFDLTVQPLSALSNGPLGWVQITNFILAGILTVLGAIGLKRVLPSKWAPRLVLVHGIGTIAAGFFTMDAGTTLTWRGYGHMAAGTVAFATLIAACYVLGRYFRRAGNRSYAIASRVAGTALLVGHVWAASGGPAGSLALAVGAITAMLWISAVSATLLTSDVSTRV